MKILVVGSGGREHALAWKLAQEAEVFATPGNPGIAEVGTCLALTPLEACREIRPDLVVVGPEDPLIAGLADELAAAGFAVFGPRAEYARLEGSKAWSKALMLEAGVPTARSGTFHVFDFAKLFAADLYASGGSAVVKASGPALGKGAVVCSTYEEAEETLAAMLVDGEFGEAGSTVVVEEFLPGREFSLLTICSDQGFVSLPVAQDHKRALDGDRGPNTGGMGTASPVSWVSADLIARTEAEVVAPILAKMPGYRGVLFSGLMVVDDRPYCLEYNVRFGDPETQTVVRRLGPGFAELLLAAARGEALPVPTVSELSAVTVVLASGGYPGSYAKGYEIRIPASFSPEVVVFQAGTRLDAGRLVTSGGRVLGVSALGVDLAASRSAAYAAADAIEFEGKFCRRDIGRRAGV